MDASLTRYIYSSVVEGTYFLQETSNWSWSSLAPFLIQSPYTGELWKEGQMKSWKVWRSLILIQYYKIPKVSFTTFLSQYVPPIFHSLHYILFYTPEVILRWNRSKSPNQRGFNSSSKTAPLCKAEHFPICRSVPGKLRKLPHSLSHKKYPPKSILGKNEIEKLIWGKSKVNQKISFFWGNIMKIKS